MLLSPNKTESTQIPEGMTAHDFFEKRREDRAKDNLEAINKAKLLIKD
jgi:hypothetical protein